MRGDTRRYRALHLVEQLQLCGVETRFVHLTDLGFERVINSCSWDVVLLHRTPYPQYLGRIVEQLKKQGTLILSDFDDLLFDPSAFQFINSPDFADSVRANLYIETIQNTQKMLEFSDGATASTCYLADQISRLCKPVWIHRNAFSLEMHNICSEANAVGFARDSRRVVIGYASGTPTHNRDFEMIRPALKQILLTYPQVDLRIIGPLDPGDGWGGTADRISHVSLVPWRRLPWLLGDFDINLAPLVTDNPFAQSKSEIKYMEAGMVGVPTVASPTDAFAFAIRSGQNGFLANTHDEWVDALSALVEDLGLRNTMGGTAFESVMVEYHPVTRAKELVERLEEISQSLRGKPFWIEKKPLPEEIVFRTQKSISNKGWMSQQYEKGPSYIQMGLFQMRVTGLMVTLQFVWVFFRRLISPLIPYKKK